MMTDDDCRSLERFVKECCHRHPLAKVSRLALLAAYTEWRAGQGKVPVTHHEFTAFVRGLPNVVERQLLDSGSSRRGWRGIALKGESN